MSSEHTRPLRDFVSLQRGTTYKGNLVGMPGPVLLGLASIEPNGGFRYSGFKTYGGECPDKILLRPGDIYVSLKDVTQSGDLLGSVARVPADIPHGRLTQDTVKVVFSGKEIPKNYIYWLLRTPRYREHCRNCATGTTTLGLAREDFLDYPVPAPSEADLLLVALLEGIENRITLLRETNTLLEQIAQTIFKSWFVDFDPVRAKLEGRIPEGMDEETAALFPDSFEESELGLVPKDWLIAKVESFAEKVGMGPFGSNIKVETFVDFGVPIISGQHLKSGLVEDGSFNFITEDHAVKLKNSCVKAGDLIFTHAGSIGQVSLLHEDARWKRYILSQRQFFLRCNTSLMRPEWIGHYFLTPQGQHKLLANTSQVGVPSIAKPVTYLRSISLCLPPYQLIERFSQIADATHRLIINNRALINTLSDLRDTLLPRLISGKLRLPEAEEMIEEVAL